MLYTHQPFHPHNHCKTALSLKKHYILASPQKRGGGTAVEVFRLAVQYSNSPAFTILKLFRAVTVGIAPYLHQPFQNRTIPPTFRRASVCVCLYGFVSALSLAPHHVLASLVKGEVLSPERIRATTGGIVTPPTFFKTALSLENRPHPRLACPSRCTEYCYLRIDLSYSIY